MWAAIRDVFEHYPKTRGRLIPPRIKMTDPAMVAIWDTIPKTLEAAASTAGLATSKDLRFYGSGQANRSAPIIPWVACCIKSVSTSVQTGYFVVLLFNEDMTGVHLSLNQGYQQYFDSFADDEISRRKSASVARTLSSKLTMPAGFVAGEIDLRANSSLGKGYEAGSILSRYYPSTDSFSSLSEDFCALLGTYRDLTKIEGTLTAIDVPVTDADFQATVNKRSKSSTKLPKPHAGPLEKPPEAKSSRGGGWRRDATMAAWALRNADFKCEIDAHHATFISRASGVPFIEAHHLVPLQRQKDFPYSLDVPENIVALCPTCHRRIHHAQNSIRRTMAISLLNRRNLDLQERGIEVSPALLQSIYQCEIDEEIGA